MNTAVLNIQCWVSSGSCERPCRTARAGRLAEQERSEEGGPSHPVSSDQIL